jgi:multisubunit Na+/H+ antiporter MnhB subunit
VARLVLPFAFLISAIHILYGGSAPGDGFTAGVISGLAVASWYLVFGYEQAKARLGWLHPSAFIGMGIALALGNAALPLVFDGSFLGITIVRELTLPAGLKLSSTLVFELAIFLTVFGGVSAVMEAIAHPREVEV